MNDNIENINDHMTKMCDCGSVNFNLLKSGAIGCSNCGVRFGQWSDLSKGIYYCGNCNALTNIDAMKKCDCGTFNWIKSDDGFIK